MASCSSVPSPSARLVLDGVCQVLLTLGFEGLTADEVRLRSGAAGRALEDPVDLEGLVVAALEPIQLITAPAPTGSLRGDLLAMLRHWRGPCGHDELVVAAVLSAAQRHPRLRKAVAQALDGSMAQAVGTVLSRATPDAEVPPWAQTIAWLLRGLLVERLRTGSRSLVDLQELVRFLMAPVESIRRGRVHARDEGASSMLSTAGPVFHELGEEECRRLMPTVSIGRLGFTENALPSIAPVHFRVIGDSVVLASLSGSQAASADRGDIVAFEVDAYEPATAEGWTVSVLGPSSRVTDPDEVEALDRLGFAPWTGNPAQCYIGIRIERIRGRRLCRATPDAAAGTHSG